MDSPSTSGVPTRILEKCKIETPPRDWVDLYLYEVAKAYNVDWRPEGFVDLSNTAGATTEDTAAQEERTLEATLSSDPVHGEGRPKSSPGNGGSADALLPSTPSTNPKLGDSVKSSTSTIPIIVKQQQPGDSANKTTSSEEVVDLPHPPPIDPKEAARTVVIKSNLGQVPGGKKEDSTAGQASNPAAATAAAAAPKSDTYDVRRELVFLFLGCKTRRRKKCMARKLMLIAQDLAKRFEALKRK
jgi:vacuolar protein sorting-associated protein IST1